MEEKKGWICLHRKFLDWEWYDDPNVVRLFIHLLLTANHQDKKWHGILIKRGQLLTSQLKLANSLKVSRMQIRNQLEKLKTTNNITILATASYSVITVVGYDDYQKNNQPFNQRITNNITNEQPTSNHKQQLNNNISNTSYINLSLSREKITKKEREILKNYLLRQKRKPDNLEAYMQTLIKNGDWVQIVEKERQRQKRIEEKQKEEKEKSEIPINTQEDEQKIEEIQQSIKQKKKQRLKSRQLG